MAARCFALLGRVAVGAFASASQQVADGPAELEVAFATEGTACASAGSAGAECELHLLQLRAQSTVEQADLAADEELGSPDREERADSAAEREPRRSPSTNKGDREEEADSAAEREPRSLSINKEAIEAMQLDDNVGPEGIASETEAIEVAQEEAIEAMDLTPVEQEAQQGIEVADEDQDAGAADEAAAAPAEEAEVVSSESAGRCTAQDAETMQRLGKLTFPQAVADCGKSAYKWFRFHQDAMGVCVRRKTGIGAPCASCFAAAGQYGFDNCKVQCLFGSWCSSLCRGCTGGFDQATQQCVGVPVPQPDIC